VLRHGRTLLTRTASPRGAEGREGNFAVQNSRVAY
jgi:hypothetical protein